MILVRLETGLRCITLQKVNQVNFLNLKEQYMRLIFIPESPFI